MIVATPLWGSALSHENVYEITTVVDKIACQATYSKRGWSKHHGA